MKILKHRLSKIILIGSLFFTFIFNQQIYADIKLIYKQDTATGETYALLSATDTVITQKVAKSIADILTQNHVRGLILGRLHFFSGTLDIIMQHFRLNPILKEFRLFENYYADERDIRLTIDILGINRMIRIFGAVGVGYLDRDINEIINALTGNKDLTNLMLRGNNIGDDGAKEIAKYLQRNRSITELDLGYNHIGDEGAFALARVIAENDTILCIWLDNNPIGNNGRNKILMALMYNVTIQNVEIDTNWTGEQTELLNLILERNQLNRELRQPNGDTNRLQRLRARLLEVQNRITIHFGQLLREPENVVPVTQPVLIPERLMPQVLRMPSLMGVSFW